MHDSDQFSDFLRAVEALHDDGPTRVTAHTSNVSAHGWTAPAPTQPAEDNTAAER